VVGPQATVTFGNQSLMHQDIGGFIAYRVPGILSIGIAAGTSVGDVASAFGECIEYCASSRWRLGASVERHFGESRQVDFWAGVDVDYIHLTGIRIGMQRDPSEKRAGFGISPMLGVDVARYGSRKMAALGLYFATPFSGVLDPVNDRIEWSMGITGGIRCVLGAF
jgi:hypothetical protein